MTEFARSSIGTVGTGRVLVAGVGNMFLSDDGFGVEVLRRLIARSASAGAELDERIELIDVGLRARDLAYQLLEGYQALVLVDATQRGQRPGTLYTLEHDLDAGFDGLTPDGAAAAGVAPDGTPAVSAPVGHETDANAVLALLIGMATSIGVERPVGRVIVVGCEPAVLDEGIGLSPPVAAAMDRAVAAVAEIATELLHCVTTTEEGVLR